jgi:hypothetical protein
VTRQRCSAGVSAQGVRDGHVPHGCGEVVHVSQYTCHGGYSYLVRIADLQPGRRYTAFLAVEDTFEIWPPDGPRAIGLHPKPIHFFTPKPDFGSVDGARAGGDGANAIEEEEAEVGAERAARWS